LTFILVFLTVASNEIVVAQQENSGDEQVGEETSPVKVTANRIIHQGDSAFTQAIGDVEIVFDGKKVTGDESALDNDTGDGFIKGDVHFTDRKSDIRADRADFNTKTGTGTLYNAIGNSEMKYFFTGERIQRIDETHFQIYKGTCSTCPHPDQDWRLDAKEINLTLEGYAYLKHMVFRVGDFPVLYSPFFIAPAKTKRSTGFLIPGIAYSTERGFMLKNSFFWAIAENMDTTITHEYMGVAGNRFGLEYRYIFSPRTFGKLNAEYLIETDPNKDTDRDFWKLKFDHRHGLPFGATNVTFLDIESENSISREYDDNVTDRTRRYADSYTTFAKNWATRNLNLTVRQRKSTLSDSEDEVNTIPDIKFTNQSEKIWGSPVYGSLQSSFTSYRTKSTQGDNSWPFDVDRFDFYPKLSLPITVAPWLTLTPAAGVRYTWYSNGESNGEVTNESFSREYYTTSLSLSGPKFFRVFHTSSPKRPKLKHLVTPSLSWSFVPGYEVDGEDRLKVKHLDGIDSSDPGNKLTYKLTNWLYAKEVVTQEQSNTLQMVKFVISQTYDITEANREKTGDEDELRPFSAILFDLDTRFFNWLMVNYNTTYDQYDHIWKTSNLEVGFRYKQIFHFSLDRGYTYPTTAWDTAYLELGLPWRTTLDYSVVYKEEDQEIYDSLLRLKYMPGCWGVILSWSKRKINTTDSSGSDQVEDEEKFLFQIILTGVGDVLGETRKPVAGKKL